MNNQASFYCFFILVDLFMNGDTHIFCVRVLRSCGPLQVIHIYTNCSDIPSALSWTRRGGAAAIKMLTTRRLKTAHVRASPKRLCDILHTAAVIKLAACLERPVSSKVEVGNCSNWLGVPPRCVRGGCSSPRQRIMTGWDGEREREGESGVICSHYLWLESVALLLLLQRSRLKTPRRFFFFNYHID